MKLPKATRSRSTRWSGMIADADGRGPTIPAPAAAGPPAVARPQLLRRQAQLRRHRPDHGYRPSPMWSCPRWANRFSKAPSPSGSRSRAMRAAGRAALRDLDRQGRRRDSLPAAGVLAEIKVPAGTTVQINTVVAVIRVGWSGYWRSRAPHAAGACCGPARSPRSRRHRWSATGVRGEGPFLAPGAQIAKENNLDLGRFPVPARRQRDQGRRARLAGAGRRKRAGSPNLPHPRPPVPAPHPRPPSPRLPRLPPFTAGDQLVPMTRMRSIIAQRMVDSKHTSAHVHTVFKVDMSRIVRIREKEKIQVRAAQRRQAYLHAVSSPAPSSSPCARCRS